MDMINKVADAAADNLIAGTYPPATVKVVKVTAPVKRGQVVTGAPDAAAAVATAALESANAAYIVAADSEDEAAEVYSAGEFNRGVVTALTGYELTDADVEVLRAKNIILTREVN